MDEPLLSLANSLQLIDLSACEDDALRQTVEKLKTTNIRGLQIDEYCISFNETGWSYKKIFEKCIDGGVTSVSICDAYLQNNHQTDNLFRFVDDLLLEKPSINQVHVITRTKNQNVVNQLETWLSKKAEFSCEFKDELHHRVIEFSNGYSVKLERGLDIFQATTGVLEEPTEVKRKCKEFHVRVDWMPTDADDAVEQTVEKLKTTKIHGLKIVEGCIPNNETGWSYEKIFEKCFVTEVTSVSICDPYLVNDHQIGNLRRFVKMLLNLESTSILEVHVITVSKNKDAVKNIGNWLLEEYSHVQFCYNLKNFLHHRIVEFSNGYSVKLDRGLDIFHAMDSHLDEEQRRCMEVHVCVDWMPPRADIIPENAHRFQKDTQLVVDENETNEEKTKKRCPNFPNCKPQDGSSCNYLHPEESCWFPVDATHPDYGYTIRKCTYGADICTFLHYCKAYKGKGGSGDCAKKTCSFFDIKNNEQCKEWEKAFPSKLRLSNRSYRRNRN